MKNTQKQRKDSGKVQVGLLAAVVMLAGGGGVWSELHAAGATVSKTTVNAIFAAGIGFGEIDDNGDGTALTLVIADLPDGSSLQGFEYGNTNFSVTADVKVPGHSGKGSASGTARTFINGFHYDPTFTEVTPTILQLDIAVDGITDVFAAVNQGVKVTLDPVTGESVIERVNSRGYQAFGATTGAFSVSVDGAVVYSEAGVVGAVLAQSQHSVTRLK